MLFLLALMTTLIAMSCASDEEETPTPPDMMDSDPIEVEIWTGSTITFTKADGADPTEEANQDRLTENVWITRGNSGGEIFNIQSESASTKDTSPAGTLWALGTTDNANNLNFASFRTAVGEPKDVIGKDLVLFLVEDEVILDIKFTSWSQGRTNGGGFAYERSTSN